MSLEGWVMLIFIFIPVGLILWALAVFICVGLYQIVIETRKDQITHE